MSSQQSNTEILSFANWFCADRVETFSKDMRICMTPDNKKRHAYMPAVMSCASFIELFAGLHSGNIKGVGIRNILKFTNTYLDSSEFTEDRICVFFEMFRHKVAHVTRPYSVFDSHSVGDSNPLKNYPHRRITWKVTATFHKPAIQIIPKKGSIKTHRRPPWKPAPYTHICKINLKRMIRELINSIDGKNGYLNRLSIDSDSRRNFVKCMELFYP